MDTVPLRDSATEVVVVDNTAGLDDTVNSAPVLRLRLKKPKPDRQVAWREGTIDNEDMGKKKSKCCCIYKKPVNFGESSSSDDEECEHCFGHPEKRRRNTNKSHDYVKDDTENNSNENRESEIDITEIHQPQDDNGSQLIHN
ncbi:E3 ubiquitin-protein ligase PPP1R11 [Bactrocera oleae]|uniref:E3 ubiquitin-protein ligase PPP1R11 n=1 Tax=Bactrocera oleae TaxID=104688 RepID=UPI0006B74630|nr:E3 ubiquitin-protein ligase PPP1R11 [Bactrocera oleae]